MCVCVWAGGDGRDCGGGVKEAESFVPWAEGDTLAAVDEVCVWGGGV